MMKPNHFSEQIKQLQNEVNGKDLENELLKNELIDVLTPSVAQSEISIIILEMLMENNLFVTKNGLTDKAKASKSRLLRLLDLNSSCDKIATANNSLKITNRLLHSEYQKLRIENMNLKKELSNINKAFEGI